MKKIWIVLLIIVLIVCFIVLNLKKEEINNFNDCVLHGYVASESYPRQCSVNNKTFVEDIDVPSIANPASVYCKDQNGELEIRTNDNGAYSVCVFDNGVECEEWALYRGDCSKDGSDFCGISSFDDCKIDNDCVKDGCSSEVCKSKYKESVNTNCMFKECYNSEEYDLDCKCINNKCQWHK